MAIANLLGVAGTDVPIRDIKKLMMPFTVNSEIVEQCKEHFVCNDLTDHFVVIIVENSWVSMGMHSL